jgi:hypothetical protein
MRNHFFAIHPLIGTKTKPAADHLQQRSPYYWWWAYLRRNQDYLACCEREGHGYLAGLYADFGDVRDENFRTWWGAPSNKGVHLFAEEPLNLSVEKIDPLGVPATLIREGVLFVAVNMELGKRRLQQKFAELLVKTHEGKRGRRSLKASSSSARYPLHRNFTAHNLKVMLNVFDAVEQNKSMPKADRLTLWQIGESLKLVPTAMPHKWDNAYDTRKKHATMTMTVSRYYKEASVIIANTSKGQFPNSEA